MFYDPQIVKKIESEIENLKSIKKWAPKFITQVRETSAWGKNLDKSSNENLMSEKETQQLLEKFYLWGFEEKPFIETMEFNN